MKLKASSPSSATLFSIGHSNHTAESFSNLLKKHNVVTLADVRTKPHSSRFPQFNGENLKMSCEEQGIQYVWMPELGGKWVSISCGWPGGHLYQSISSLSLSLSLWDHFFIAVSHSCLLHR
jgi:hypothetical protein